MGGAYVMYDFIKRDETTTVFCIGNKFKRIELIIDSEDEDKIKNFPFNWRMEKDNFTISIVCYAYSKGKSARVELGQLLLGTTNDKKIIHKNGDLYDFRKENLKGV